MFYRVYSGVYRLIEWRCNLIYKNASKRKNITITKEINDQLEKVKNKINVSALIREFLQEFIAKNPQLFN